MYGTMRARIYIFPSLVFISACGSLPPDQSVGRPITTAIPQGIYVGEITTRTQTWLNGVLLDDTTTTEPSNEVVDSNGLPLIQPGGETPVEGLVVISDIGTISSRLTVESVNSFGNRLVIGYTTTLEFEGLVIGGTGTWTWQYVPPNTLEFLDLFDGISNVSEFGDVATLSVTATATLTR